jgi:hypothetical protein
LSKYGQAFFAVNLIPVRFYQKVFVSVCSVSTNILRDIFMECENGSQVNVENKNYDRRGLLRFGVCAGLGLALGQAGLSCCPQGSACKTKKMVEDDEFTMVAYCCLECDKCDAYIATQNNDEKLRAKVAEQWKMDIEKINCDGCKSDNALFNCEAKKCAIARGLPTCAHCDDFPSCDKEIWTKWPQLKKKTEDMRAKLQSKVS